MRRYITLLLLAFPLYSQAPPTLDQLIQEALQHNLNLLAECLNIPIAEARIIQAKIRPNPTLLTQWQYIDALGSNFSAARNPAGPPEVDLGVLYPWVRGGKRNARIDLARLAKQSDEADLLDKSRLLTFDVQAAYLDLLLAREAIVLIGSSREKIAQIARINTQRARAGEIAQVELYRSEVAALQFDVQFTAAETRLRQARLRLQSLAGRPTFDPAFDVAGTFRRDLTLSSQAEVLSAALANRADIARLRSEIAESRANLRLQIANSKPDWNLGLIFSRQYNIGIRNGNALNYQAYIPLPIFDKNQGEIEKARQSISQSEARLAALEHTVRLEVAAAYAVYESALALLRRYEDNLIEKPRRVRDIMQYSYQRGEASLLEFLDAQRIFNEASTGYQEARAEFARALYLLDAIAGKNL